MDDSVSTPQPPGTSPATPKKRGPGRPPKPRTSTNDDDDAKKEAKKFRVDNAEMADFFTDTFELFAEGIGAEWELDDGKAKRMGKRWATLANRWIDSVTDELALSVVLKVLFVFALVELVAVFGVRAIKSVKRVRKERDEEEAREKEHAAAAATAVPAVRPVDDNDDDTGVQEVH